MPPESESTVNSYRHSLLHELTFEAACILSEGAQ